MTAPGLFLEGHAGIAGSPVFGPVSIAAPGGRWTCLLGPSGVGKSTVLRLLAGIAEGVDFEGRLGAEDGVPVEGRAALMAQDDRLLPWLDALGNVTLGARLRGETVDVARGREMLARVGLEGLEARRPGALSGGQRQRLALARTLMEDRPLVLLDEPFSALDAKTRSEMQDLAAHVLKGRTVLHVTHDPGEAVRLAERIVLMEGGGAREIAPPAAPPPRAVDAPETLAAQAGLLGRLMAGAP